MGAYKYISQTFKEEYKQKDDIFKSKLVEWRSEPVMLRVFRPTNISRARNLGYKAKKGYFVVRVRIRKGNRRRINPRAGRNARHAYRYTSPNLSLQAIAEQRVARKYRNAEVLNSYWVGEDGRFKWFEVILADRVMVNIPQTKIKGKAFRGLTSIGRKARGLRRKGRRKQRI